MGGCTGECLFYKRRDYSVVVDGRNPIVSHEFLGDNVEGKDVIVVDDMISSGDSMIDVCRQLKKLKARRIFVFSSFGLFSSGLERFDKAYEEALGRKLGAEERVYDKAQMHGASSAGMADALINGDSSLDNNYLMNMIL